jgi:hypothetical protein
MDATFWCARYNQSMREATPNTIVRRRWFQFGLGTLFLVVTAFAVWLGLELQFIRARQAWLRDHPRWGLDPTHFQTSVPRWRLWLGDSEVHWIFMPIDSSKDEIDRAHQLFPEVGSISLMRPEEM